MNTRLAAKPTYGRDPVRSSGWFWKAWIKRKMLFHGELYFPCLSAEGAVLVSVLGNGFVRFGLWEEGSGSRVSGVLLMVRGCACVFLVQFGGIRNPMLMNISRPYVEGFFANSVFFFLFEWRHGQRRSPFATHIVATADKIDQQWIFSTSVGPSSPRL